VGLNGQDNKSPTSKKEDISLKSRWVTKDFKGYVSMTNRLPLSKIFQIITIKSESVELRPLALTQQDCRLELSQSELLENYRLYPGISKKQKKLTILSFIFAAFMSVIWLLLTTMPELFFSSNSSQAHLSEECIQATKNVSEMSLKLNQKKESSLDDSAGALVSEYALLLMVEEQISNCN
jgi:hypothetical protein